MTIEARRRGIGHPHLVDRLGRPGAARTGTIALLVLACLSAPGCGGSPASPAPLPTPPPTPPPCAGLVLSAVMSDPAGDVWLSTNPDLVGFRAAVADCQLTLTITFAPGTLSPGKAAWQVSLDTDENAATGFPGRDAGNTDAAAMGAEYFVERDTDDSIARVKAPWVPAANGTVPVTIAGNQLVLVLPLTMLGNDDGRMVFSVIVSRVLGPGANTAILDYLPDRGAALPRTR